MRSRRALLFAIFALILISTALSTRRADASPGWEKILDRPTPNFGSVDFVSDSEGWMVAGAGLLHTTDGGATWTEATRQLTVSDIDFIDQRHGWAVGPSGAIYATTDGGASWNAQTSGTHIHLINVHAVSTQEAWVLGEYEGYSDVIIFPVPTVLLHTTDGGNTWVSVDLPPNTSFSEMVFAGSSGWLLGGHCKPPPEYQYCSGPGSVDLLRTADGGATWALQQTDLPGIVHSLAFADETHGWLSASACTTPTTCIIGVYRTTDGGATWTPGDLGFNGLVGASVWRDDSTGWVVEHDCLLEARCNLTTTTMRILRTNDGGITWAQVSTLNLPSDLQGAGPLGLFDSTLYLTGSGVAYRSMDEGATWQAMEHPAISFDSNVEFVDQQTGYVISRGDLLRSDDAGRNWHRVGPVPNGARFQLRFVDADTGFTTGHETCTTGSCRSVLWRTRNGGGTWEPVFTVTGESQYFGDLHFLGQRGWLVLEGAIAVTSDGGATWTQHALPGGWYIGDFAVADATQIWAVMGIPDSPPATYPVHYELERSSDDGQTWEAVRELHGNSSTQIAFVDREHGWYGDYVCQDSCTEQRYATSDGGVTWQTADPGLTYTNDLVFVDQLNGWANGNRCDATTCSYYLQHTADGGATWSTQASGDLLQGQLEFVDVEHGWLTLSQYRGKGIGGGPVQRTVLYRTTDAGGGPVGHEQELPKVGRAPAAGRWQTDVLLLALIGCALVAGGALMTRRRPYSQPPS